MAEINDFSGTDASNTARWPEGMALSAVNDAARATEGILGRWYQDRRGIAVVTGSGGAYVLTVNQTIPALYDGLDVTLRPNHVNPGASTLALNGLAAAPIKIGGDVDTFPNLFKIGQVVRLVYDGTNFQVVSGLSVVDTAAPNVFTADQTIDKTGSLAIFTVQSDLNTGVPGIIRINGHDSGGVDQVYAEIQGGIVDNTSGAETGAIFLRTPVAGTFSNKIVVRQGLYAADAIGADAGEDNANFTGYFGSGAFLLPGYKAGLQVTRTGNRTIGIAAGSIADSADAEMIPAGSAASLDLNTPGDLVNGAVLAADTWYHVLVGRQGTTYVQGFSPTIAKPAAWDSFRRLTSVLTDASSNIVPFINVADRYIWSTPFNDRLANIATTEQQVTLTVPPQVRVLAQVSALLWGSGSFTAFARLYPTDATNAVINAENANLVRHSSQEGGQSWGDGTANVDILTDTSRQINVRGNVATFNFRVNTFGWQEIYG